MIRNEFALTKDLYVEWCKEAQKKSISGKFRIFWIALSMIMFIMGIALLISDLKEKMFGIYFLALGIFCVFRSVRYDYVYKAQYKQLAEKMGGENWIRTVDFTDDGIITTNGNITVKNMYSEIKGVRTDGNKIYLDMDKNSVIRLYMDSFTQGSYESFRSIIKEKQVYKI